MTIDHPRVMSAELRSRIMSAEEAAALVPNGANVGMSGFTGSGYPKSVPLALAEAAAAGRLRPDQIVVINAMGGGFTWGAALLRW